MAIAGPPDRAPGEGDPARRGRGAAGRRQERSAPDRGRQATRADRPRPPSRGPRRRRAEGRRRPAPAPPQRGPTGEAGGRADGRRRPADRPSAPRSDPKGAEGARARASGPEGARGPGRERSPGAETGRRAQPGAGRRSGGGAKAEHTTEAPPKAGQLGRGATVAGPGPRPSSMGCGGRSPRGPRRRRGRAAEPPGRA